MKDYGGGKTITSEDFNKAMSSGSVTVGSRRSAVYGASAEELHKITDHMLEEREQEKMMEAFIALLERGELDDMVAERWIEGMSHISRAGYTRAYELRNEEI